MFSLISNLNRPWCKLRPFPLLCPIPWEQSLTLLAAPSCQGVERAGLSWAPSAVSPQLLQPLHELSPPFRARPWLADRLPRGCPRRRWSSGTLCPSSWSPPWSPSGISQSDPTGWSAARNFLLESSCFCFLSGIIQTWSCLQQRDGNLWGVFIARAVVLLPLRQAITFSVTWGVSCGMLCPTADPVFTDSLQATQAKTKNQICSLTWPVNGMLSFQISPCFCHTHVQNDRLILNPQTFLNTWRVLYLFYI